MKLEYDYHSKDRVYTFCCSRCDTTVRVMEEISESMREAFMADGYPLEPLTRDEELEQAEAKRLQEKFGYLLEDFGGAKRDERSREKLSDDEAERLR